jgi:LysM repeat protein
MATPKIKTRLTAQLLLAGCCWLLAACSGSQETPTPTTAPTAATLAPAPRVTVAIDQLEPPLAPADESTIGHFDEPGPNDQLEPPPTPDDETPLQSILDNVPQTIVVQQTLPKSKLAASLHTTVEQLQYANPDLEDPVLAGKLIVVPSGYRVIGEETLAEIAASTGIAEAELRKSNELDGGNTPLAAGTTIQFPPQYVVQKDIALADLAALLGVSPEQLSAANPYLSQSDTVAANTLIVLPTVSNDQ